MRYLLYFRIPLFAKCKTSINDNRVPKFEIWELYLFGQNHSLLLKKTVKKGSINMLNIVLCKYKGDYKPSF